MTAQRRGLLLRVAAVGALVSGAVLLPATAALADVQAQPGSLTLKPGEEKSITVTLTEGDAATPEATFTIQGLGNDVTLKGPGGCGNSGGAFKCDEDAFDREGLTQKVTITVTHKSQTSVQQGQTKEGSINVDAGEDDSVNVTLQGPQQAAGATEVTGKVNDQTTGDGVGGAQLSLKDSAGTTHDATANNQGNFSIKPGNGKTIAPGAFTVTATKEGFADATANGTAQSGKATGNLQLRMKPTAASTAPSAPVASDTPTDAASEQPAAQASPQNTSGNDEGTSMLSWVLIGMGVLLVLLGIGAIVLLVMRRKDDSDDPDGYGNDPNQMVPAGGAAAYGGPAATMVGGRSNMNDATAIVGPQQQLDEFPDPYAAPAPAPTRVGGAAYSGGYNDTQATNVAPGYGRGDYANGGGYRDERGYGAESQRGGYGDEGRGAYSGGAGGGAGGGGYADQPAGHYQGGGDQGGYPAAGGYPAGANGSEYGGGANGYGGGGANGYDGGGAANGYGGGNGSANGGGANGYGGGGYEGDYGRAGGGYQGQQGGQAGPPGPGGPAGPGGYERGGGDYAGEQRNGRNRSVDWLE